MGIISLPYFHEHAVPANSPEFAKPKSTSSGNTGKGGASHRPDAGNGFGGVSHGVENTGSAAAGAGVAAGHPNTTILVP